MRVHRVPARLGRMILTAAPRRLGARAAGRAVAAARNLPLFWKLLLPFAVLMLAVGSVGTYVVVADASARASAAVDQDAARRSVDARAILHDRELYLVESATYAGNLSGMAAAVRAHDGAAAGRLLQSVVALKPDIDVAAVTDAAGATLAEFRRDSGGRMSLTPGDQWAAVAPIRDASRSGTTASGFTAGGQALLVTATPICGGSDTCAPVGMAVVAVDAGAVARAGTVPGDAETSPGATSLALYGPDGGRVASAGPSLQAAQAPTEAVSGTAVSRDEIAAGAEVRTLYTPFILGGRPAGTLAVAVSRQAAVAGVRGAALRISGVMLAAILGVIAIGALLSRWVLRQVRGLLAANRSIGAGDLEARVAVVTGDELGELAAGVNEMAERLRASTETLETQVAQRTEEVRRLLHERTEFFAGLSHQLRTPLAVIRTQAEMLGDASADPVRGGATIGECAEEVMGVVNEILDLARHEAGGVEVAVQPVDPGEEIERLRPTAEALAGGAGIEATISIEPGLPPVLADPRRLREVLLNVVDNAVKYTPAGGRLAIVARRDGGEVVIDVADTGVGIPADVGRRVFEPFYRVRGTAPQRGQASSGLGLALARKLLEAQGGSIGYESVPGAGSTFHVRLARADAEEGAVIGPAGASEAPPVAVVSHPRGAAAGSAVLHD